MERVRLGILGTGNIAAMNVRGYLEDPRCDVVAVCDTDEAVGRRATEEWGARSFYRDVDDLLADESIDAVPSRQDWSASRWIRSAPPGSRAPLEQLW